MFQRKRVNISNGDGRYTRQSDGRRQLLSYFFAPLDYGAIESQRDRLELSRTD